MDNPDPGDLYGQYRQWTFRLEGTKKSRHHLIPRCRWEEAQGFFRRMQIGEIKKGETISLTNERHALWHNLFGIRTPLEIIKLIQRKKIDFRNLNDWQKISWLIIFFDLEAEEACFQAGEFKQRFLKDQQMIEYLVEVVVRYWSPKVFQEFTTEELLYLAALFYKIIFS